MPSTRETGLVTVAAIRQPRRAESVEVLFHEYQRIFTLAVTGRARTTLTSDLRTAARRLFAREVGAVDRVVAGPANGCRAAWTRRVTERGPP